MDGQHQSRIIDAATGNLEYMDRDHALDFTWRAVRGTRYAVRKQAAGAIAMFLRNGGELPLPTLPGFENN